MRYIPSSDSVDKIPASALSHYPKSSIFPGMVKIPYGEPAIQQEDKKIPTKHKSKKDIVPKNNKDNLVPLGVAAVSGFVLGTQFGTERERPIDNLPAGLIGAAVCSLAFTGTIGFYVAKYGGFFDKDRDYKVIFKNL
jgi:hypothetical protein